MDVYDEQQLNDDLVETSTELARQVQVNVEIKANVSKVLSQLEDALAQIQELQKQLEASYDTVLDGNVQAVIDSKDEGDTIKLPPGEYRLNSPLSPKKNQKFLCDGVTFKGSVILGTWSREGDYYVASGVLPAAYIDAGVCEIISGEEANSCRILEDVFNGGNKLERVMQLKNLSKGKVYADYTANKLYILDVPDNVEMSRTRFFMNSAVDGVRVHGLNVFHFASPSQQGALTIKGKGWEVDNCLFAYNHASGLHAATADSLHVHHSTFRDNGQAGMTHYKTNDSLIEFNLFEENNTAGYYKRDWESAGLKITYSQRVVVSNNISIGNTGIGIWVDIDNKDISILNNTVKNNFSCGIRYEISFDGQIKYNQISGNGYGHAGPGRGSDYSGFATAGIHVNGAGGVGDGILLIEGNDIGKNQNALHIEERNRGKSPTYGINWTTRNVKVRNNKMNITRALDSAGKSWYGTGVVGMGQLGTVVSDVYTAGNEFEGNKYYTNNLSEPQFHVRDTAINQYKTFKRWQELGYDKTGSIAVV